MTKPNVLFIDDDRLLLDAVQRNLRREFSVAVAENGPRAIELIRQQRDNPFAAVVCDMRMPGPDGIKVLECVRALSPDTVRIMLTGNADKQTAIDSVNREQIFRFLNKPCPPEEMAAVLQAAVKRFDIAQVERELLESTLTGSVKAISELLGMVVPEAQARGQHLRDAMRNFAEAAEISPLWELDVAATLCLIGHASLPGHVLRKMAARVPLTSEEEAMLRRSPQVAHDLLAPIPRLEQVARIVLFQNKQFDGGGFPGERVSGDAIPAGARMLKILLDRMHLESEGFVRMVARKAMADRHGHYDPDLLDVCFTCIPDRLLPDPAGLGARVANFRAFSCN